MPFVAAPKVLCIVCQKTVYANEELRIGEGISYHKTCFRCHHCNKVLQNTNYSQYNGIVYCKPHFMSLFKARGKYDDLATGDATARISNVVKENLSRTTAMSLSEMKQDSSASRGSVSSGKKDMGAALRSRNPQAVQALIEKKGLGVCFKAGNDGVTPIELAFANGNVECGRVMVKAIQDALNSKDYEMHKPDTEEDKNDVPVTRAYSQSVAAVSAPAPVVAQEPAAVSAAPRRSSIEDRIRKFSDPKPVEAPAAQAVEEPERHLITVKPNVAIELKTESSHEHSNDEHAYYASEETKNWLSSPMSSPEGAKQWEKHTSPRADNVPQGSFNNSAINA